MLEDFWREAERINLLEITLKANLELSEEQKGTLVEMTTFKLRTRYPDYKNRFQKKATRPFAEEKIKKMHRRAPSEERMRKGFLPRPLEIR